MADLKPDAVVLVATVRALKYNGGVKKEDLGTENLEALKKGIINLEKHIENVSKYGVPCVVTLNQFVTDTEAELNYVKEFCEERGCEFALSQVWEKGGEGGGREEHRHAAAEKAAAAHRLCPRRLLPGGDEKTVSLIDRRYGAFDGRRFVQRRTARRADRDRSRSSGRLYRRAVRRSHRRINNRE